MGAGRKPNTFRERCLKPFLNRGSDTIWAEGPIGVLCGGPSAEREISLKSGRAVLDALQTKGLDVVLVELSHQKQRIPEEIRKANLRVAFIALHGAFGEDGTIQAILESMGIPYTGSGPEASHYAMDKVFARRRWRAAGLAVPRWIQSESINATSRAKTLRFPIMVKPSTQGSSVGMNLVEDPSELPDAIEEASRYDETLILEEYLKGKELTVGILEDEPLPVIQICPKRPFYDFVAKYTPGMTEYLVPAPLSDETTREVQECAIKAHRLLGCRSFSRVDLILVPKREPVLLELNTIPGMTATSLLPKAALSAGLSFAELCLRMLFSAYATQGAVGLSRCQSVEPTP